MTVSNQSGSWEIASPEPAATLKDFLIALRDRIEIDSQRLAELCETAEELGDTERHGERIANSIERVKLEGDLRGLRAALAIATGAAEDDTTIYPVGMTGAARKAKFRALLNAVAPFLLAGSHHRPLRFRAAASFLLNGQLNSVARLTGRTVNEVFDSSTEWVDPANIAVQVRAADALLPRPAEASTAS